MQESNNEEASTWVPWSSYHAAKKRSKVRLTDINAIIPIIDELVHTLDMQYHSMVMISKTIGALNPGQLAVDTADEPIFALTKELMYRFPEQFGPDKYFCLFGSLHIEKSVLALCGQLLNGSGLDQLMSSIYVIVGAQSLFTVNDIK